MAVTGHGSRAVGVAIGIGAGTAAVIAVGAGVSDGSGNDSRSRFHRDGLDLGRFFRLGFGPFRRAGLTGCSSLVRTAFLALGRFSVSVRPGFDLVFEPEMVVVLLFVFFEIVFENILDLGFDFNFGGLVGVGRDGHIDFDRLCHGDCGQSRLGGFRRLDSYRWLVAGCRACR